MHWLSANLVSILNIVGLLCDIIGAMLVSYEVVKQFEGKKFEGTAQFSFDRDVVVTPPAKETVEYHQWDRRKYKFMKIGLTFLLLGFLLQIAANVLQISNTAV